MSQAITKLLYTRREAAEVLGLSERYLFNLERRGELRPVKAGRAVRYKVSDINALIDRMAGDHEPTVA